MISAKNQVSKLQANIETKMLQEVLEKAPCPAINIYE